MVTFLFVLEEPSANQDPQHSIKCYESATGENNWTLIDTVLVSTLPLNGSTGKRTYICEPANSASFHILSPVSAAGVEYPLSVQKIIPPTAPELNVLTLFVNVADIDGDKRPGVPLSIGVIPGKTLRRSGGIVISGSETTHTDIHGFASLKVVADIGEISATVGDVKITLNTNGKGGMAVDLAGLI